MRKISSWHASDSEDDEFGDDEQDDFEWDDDDFDDDDDYFDDDDDDLGRDSGLPDGFEFIDDLLDEVDHMGMDAADFYDANTPDR